MVEMHVEGLSLDPQTRKPIVILRQNDGKGLLPLWIGAMEAMTISLVLNGEELPRPLAHDLLLMVAKALNGTLTGVDIVDYRDDIYYAVLLLRGPSGLNQRGLPPLGRHRPGPARLGAHPRQDRSL